MIGTTIPLGNGATLPKPLPRGVVLRKGPRRGHPRQTEQPASREAQRVAAVILEVLAGVRTPPDAAAAFGVSLPRYYLRERRALAGLVYACEPRSTGNAPSPQRQIATLEKEIAHLRQDCARQQALVRAAQRTIGLGPPPPPKPATKAGKGPTSGAGKTQRKRRPVVRALKAAAALRTAVNTGATQADSASVVLAEVLQRSAQTSPAQPAALLHGAAAVPGH